MNIKEFFYNSLPKRAIMRFIEIFVISGVIGVVGSSEFTALVPAAFIGLIAMAIKILREQLTKE